VRPIYERCCGLDVHKKTVVACRLAPEGQQTQSFGTMTDELIRLRLWLQAGGVTHVAMESTGVYWKPVYNLLEDQGMELLVVNARHVKAVPGRKTDVKDAEWLAELLQHGLLKASFIPDRESRERRELVRYRRSLVEQRAHLVQRIQKLLEGANIKLGDVASDVMGVSARAMLQALAEGVDDPAAVAGMAKTALRNKIPELERALTGSVGGHQRFLLRSQFRLLESMEAEIAALDEEVAERMRPFQVALDRLDDIPGIGRRAAEQILVETGIDMSRFPTSAHFASWARVCPGTNESAGKRRPASIGAGNRWLRNALLEAAWTVSHSRRPTFFTARYRRLAARRGRKRAAVAIAHSLLIAVYHVLKEGVVFQDLGPAYLDRRQHDAVVRRSLRRLEALGYRVTVEAVSA
jgi:transposase